MHVAKIGLISRIAPVVLACPLAAACGGQGPSASPPPTALSAPPTGAPVRATPSPVVTVPPTVQPSVTPSPSPRPSPSPATGEPPTATLDDGTSVVIGALRSHCWQGTCADALELPPKSDLPPLAVDQSAIALELRLDGAAGFLSWSAAYGDGPLVELTPLDRGGEPYDPDLSPAAPPTITEAEIALPPSGDWIVYVVIRALDGEAHYAWRVTLP